jgi:HEAT repeat protein
MEGIDGNPRLERARELGNEWAERRKRAEQLLKAYEEAAARMVQLGIDSVDAALAILQNRSESVERRESAALVLGNLRHREAVDALIDALAEGDQKLSWMCMWALTRIGSRRGARRLIEIARRSKALMAKQEAVYTLWQLEERRAESLFINLSAGIDKEEEYTRDMATEALGNTWWRPRTQKAIAARLFDPSVSVRYSALCASARICRRTLGCLRGALVAKLSDPDRVDDNRIIAELAARILGQAVNT